MSYSRPATGQVSVRGARERQTTRVFDQNGSVRAGPNRRAIDASSVDIAGRNAERQFNEIQNFIDQVKPIAKQVGESVLNQQANAQLGELIKEDPAIGTKYLQGDADARSRISSLNGYTKDLFLQSQTNTSLNAYQNLFANLAMSDSRLTGENALKDPDAFASALSEQQQKAMDLSGMNNLPEGYRGAAASQIGQVNGVVKGKLFAAQNTEAKQTQLTGIGDGLVTDVEGMVQGVSQIERETDDPKEAEFSVGQAQNIWKTELVENVKKGILSPKEHLSTFLSRSSARLDEMAIQGNWKGARNLLKGIRLLSAGDIKLENGLDYWDQSIPLSNGQETNISKWLTSKDTYITNLQSKIATQKSLEKYMPLIVAAGQGSNSARVQIIGLLPEIAALDPTGQALTSVLSVFSSVESFGQVATVDTLDLALEVLKPGRDREALNERIRDLIDNDQLPLSVGLQLIRSNLTGTPAADEKTQKALQAAENARRSGMMDQTVAELRREQVAYNNRNGIKNPTDRQSVNALESAAVSELTLSAVQDTVRAIQEGLDAGKPLTGEQIENVFNNSLNKEKNRRIQQLQGNASASKTVADTIVDDLNEMEKNVREGKTGIDRFPKRILDLARRRGIPLNRPDSFNRLQKEMIGQMQSVISPDGTPEFPNPGQTLSDLIKRAEKTFKDNTPVNRRQSGTPQSGGTNYKGGPNRSGTQSTNEGDQVKTFINDGLLDIAGALLPGGGSAANAGELPQPVLNEEQIQLLAKMWQGREAPSLKTPGLPQVSAETETAAVPLAINNDKHPFFIAIGIAEGTRTASGEYTRAYYGHRDAGDGNLNRGTVSGGRGNNLTPEQVDRQWMGVLTSQSLKFASVLKGLGLQPGTQGYNRTMFNLLDLSVQSPAAVSDFLRKLKKVATQGWSIEALAKARADSFYGYDGTLNTTFPNYQALFRDQRSRAGVWDYRRRL